MKQTITNFAIYEDSVDFRGMAKASVPDLNALTQSISGAGIAGNVTAVVPGHFEAMTLGLSFPVSSEDTIRLSAGRHRLDLRASMLGEDPATRTIKEQAVKHIFIADGKGEKGGTIAPASPSDGSVELAVQYWATFLDGVKVREIDPLNYICIVDGVDYLAASRRNLGK